MTMVISQTQTGFSVTGLVTFDNVAPTCQQGEALIQAFQTKNKHCEINLENMREENAASLALMLAWVRAAKKSHVTLVFTAVSGSLQRMITAFGLTDLMNTSSN